MIAAAVLIAVLAAPMAPWNDARRAPPERWLIYRVGDTAIGYDVAQMPRHPPAGVVAIASLIWNAPESGAAFRWGELIHRVDCAAGRIGMTEGSRYDADGRLLGRDRVDPARLAPAPSTGAAAILFRAVCGGRQPAPLFEITSLQAAVERLNRLGLR